MAVAGSITKTEGTSSNGVQRIQLDWTSDASGNVTENYHNVFGQILRIVFVPSASAAPTANYDIVLNDIDLVDVAAGLGANLSATVTTSACPATNINDGVLMKMPYVVAGRLELKVSNAGNAKAGSVILYVK